MLIYLKFIPCGHWCQKREKMLFTKIELKGEEAQRRKNNKRERSKSTKTLSTQIGGAESPSLVLEIE
jgi:hypothetical protein